MGVRRMEREKTEIYSRNPYEGTDFPLLVLHVDQRRCEPENQGFLHTHWHEELQFVYVTGARKRPAFMRTVLMPAACTSA